MTPQETAPDLPVSVQESLAEPRASGGGPRPPAGVGALSVGVRKWDLLKEIAIIFVTSTTGSLQSVVSNLLLPQGLQHTRPLYSSPAPGVCSNLGPLSQ